MELPQVDENNREMANFKWEFLNPFALVKVTGFPINVPSICFKRHLHDHNGIFFRTTLKASKQIVHTISMALSCAPFAVFENWGGGLIFG